MLRFGEVLLQERYLHWLSVLKWLLVEELDYLLVVEWVLQLDLVVIF